MASRTLVVLAVGVVASQVDRYDSEYRAAMFGIVRKFVNSASSILRSHRCLGHYSYRCIYPTHVLVLPLSVTGVYPTHVPVSLLIEGGALASGSGMARVRDKFRQTLFKSSSA